MKTILLALLFAAGGAQALPLPKGPRSLVRLPATFTANYNFDGIVALDDCSGSIIRFENSQDSDPAMVLTNGHCFEGGFPAPSTFISNQASDRQFGVMDSSGESLGTLQAVRVLYSTMTGTDITLYQTAETYAQIQSQWTVHALTLSSQHPAVGQPIEVISGYWDRGYSCNIEAFVYQLHEGGYIWNDSMRYSRPGCEVIGGTSGSPVILGGTRTMIGINNTGNEDGQKCTDNNPCEVDQNGGITYQQGYSYAEETYLIYSCIDSTGKFSLETPGCQLLH